MPTVTFKPTGVVAQGAAGESLFDVGRREHVDINTACVGKATCGLCRIKILEGEEHLNEFTDIEEKHLGNVYFLTKTRLSCQTLLTGGDVVVELAPKKTKKPKQASGPKGGSAT